MLVVATVVALDLGAVLDAELEARELEEIAVLALDFNLATAQEIVAVEAGHRSWAELKAANSRARKAPRVSS